MIKFGSTAITDLQTQQFRVTDPDTGEEIDGVTITLMGPAHPDRKRLEVDLANAARRVAEKAGRIKLGDAATDRRNNLEKLARCTVAWEGLTDDDAPLPCTYENALKLYGSNEWLFGQMLGRLNGSEGFTTRAVAR